MTTLVIQRWASIVRLKSGWLSEQPVQTIPPLSSTVAQILSSTRTKEMDPVRLGSKSYGPENILLCSCRPIPWTTTIDYHAAIRPVQCIDSRSRLTIRERKLYPSPRSIDTQFSRTIIFHSLLLTLSHDRCRDNSVRHNESQPHDHMKRRGGLWRRAPITRS